MSENVPYSKRQAQIAKSQLPAPYVYDRISNDFRVQVHYAVTKAVGDYQIQTTNYVPPSSRIWKRIVSRVGEERGLLEIGSPRSNAQRQFVEYLQLEKDPERVLDAVEIALQVVQESLSPQSESAQDAIAMVNRRFREHDLGYSFSAVPKPGSIIRVDSQYTYEHIVIPAISSLASAGFEGALDEFIAAHCNYRHGDSKAAVNEALKAFESTMKSICETNGWEYPPHPTANQLVPIMMEHQLVPIEFQHYFSGVRSLLEGGVPTARNRKSAHGQGLEIVGIPDFLAAFALNLTAANIVFLMDSNYGS